MAASYAMLTGCTVRYIKNPDFLLEKAVEEMVQVSQVNVMARIAVSNHEYDAPDSGYGAFINRRH